MENRQGRLKRKNPVKLGQVKNITGFLAGRWHDVEPVLLMTQGQRIDSCQVDVGNSRQIDPEELWSGLAGKQGFQAYRLTGIQATTKRNDSNGTGLVDGGFDHGD